DQREVERNNEYYAPLFGTVDEKGKPYVQFDVISGKIQRGLDSATLFLSSVPPIYRHFTRSVTSYDRAVRLFSEINSEFLSLDDIYLYYDPAFDKKLSDLKSHYDSARYYFDRYLELIKNYPIPLHRQQYRVKPIVTYRLDGLITRMNFLTPQVEFWDYGSWVDKVRKSVTDEIATLRNRLSQNEIRLTENLSRIEASNGEGVAPVPLDKQVVFNLNNYEKQSLVLALLEYKFFKQDWLIKAKTYVPDTLDGERNATLFSMLVYANRTADTLLSHVRERATRDKIRKHGDFITKHYGGSEGLQKYMDAEREHIRVTFEQYTGGLRTALLNMATIPVAAATAKPLRFANRWNVSISVQSPTPEALAKGDPITLQSRQSPDGSYYLAGTHRPDKKTNLSVAFVARVMPDGKPGWFHAISHKADSLSATADSHHVLGPFELTQEGCVVVVRAVPTSSSTARNAMIYLSEKGEEKFHVRLADRQVPRTLTFSERSNSFVLLYKGLEETPNYSVPEQVILVGINALGDKQWRRQVTLAGGITGLVNLIDGHLLAGNFTMLRDLAGKEHTAKAGESNPFLIRFNDRGDIERILPVMTTKPVYMTRLVKVSDRSINLLGTEGTLASGGKSALAPDQPVAHIMTNRLCEIVCTNIPR
ncbi:MAG: hypothetical protein JNN04_04115, partial [Cyclobacteriaceae bacterium]|nr:hypothetical protein [Cyclobacteriaceae bacterium]